MTPSAAEPIHVDVRIIAATNRNLSTGGNRVLPQDLLLPTHVLRIEMPPLRDRKGDIPELARHFATQFALRDGRAVPELAPDFMADLMQRDWPGNVRELENYIERVMTMTDCDVLHAERRERDTRRSRRHSLSNRGTWRTKWTRWTPAAG